MFSSPIDTKHGYKDIFKHKYFVAKFEDCKIKPNDMFRKICSQLCIPFQEKMLYSEAPESGNIEGENIKGMDLLPLNRRIDHIFSSFDKLRLDIIYAQMAEHYGYEYFDFAEHDLTDEEIDSLLLKPLRIEQYLFEKCYSRVKEDMEWDREYDFVYKGSKAKMYFEDADELRHEMVEIMRKMYGISRYEKIKFPFFLRASIEKK